MGVLQDILAAVQGDAPVREVRIGPFWTGVWSRGCGLASTQFAHEHSSGPPVREAGSLTTLTARQLCSCAAGASLLERCVALAALNSLLEVDLGGCREVNAADLLLERGWGKRVCVVGHFPFIPRLREVAAELWVLERHPREGDLPAEEAGRVIPEAEVVAITGTALLNQTMDDLLGLCSPRAFVMVVGPTTPLSPVWFDYGVQVVSGTVVTDPPVVLRLISEGVVFNQIRGRGVKLVTLMKD